MLNRNLVNKKDKLISITAQAVNKDIHTWDLKLIAIFKIINNTGNYSIQVCDKM